MSNSKNRGFTIYEILGVMFIVALLSTVLFTNYRGGQKKYALEQDAQELVSNLRRVQNMAMSGVGISQQYYGYGIYLEEGNDYYEIYGDTNNNDKYSGGDDIIETVNLSERIIIDQIISPLAPPKIDFFFGPPDPTTFINADSSAGLAGTIILKIEGANLTKSVSVNTAGLIQ